MTFFKLHSLKMTRIFDKVKFRPHKFRKMLFNVKYFSAIKLIGI